MIARINGRRLPVYAGGAAAADPCGPVGGGSVRTGRSRAAHHSSLPQLQRHGGIESGGEPCVRSADWVRLRPHCEHQSVVDGARQCPRAPAAAVTSRPEDCQLHPCHRILSLLTNMLIKSRWCVLARAEVWRRRWPMRKRGSKSLCALGGWDRCVAGDRTAAGSVVVRRVEELQEGFAVEVALLVPARLGDFALDDVPINRTPNLLL